MVEEMSASVYHCRHFLTLGDSVIEKAPIDDRLSEADLGTFFRPRDAEAAGISYPQLRRLEGLGLVQREAWGLYRQTQADVTRHHTIAEVCARVSQAVVCLLSALEVHEIGTQRPHEVWIAIPHKARVPRMGGLPVRVTRFSAMSLTYGVVATEFEGVAAKITTPGPHGRGLLSVPEQGRSRTCCGGAPRGSGRRKGHTRPDPARC